MSLVVHPFSWPVCLLPSWSWLTFPNGRFNEWTYRVTYFDRLMLHPISFSFYFAFPCFLLSFWGPTCAAWKGINDGFPSNSCHCRPSYVACSCGTSRPSAFENLAFLFFFFLIWRIFFFNLHVNYQNCKGYLC